MTAFHSETPKWAKAVVQEDVKTAREILPNYAPFIEGITQGRFDAIEEKGIAYAAGYLTREVLSSVLALKLSKISGTTAAKEETKGTDNVVADGITNVVNKAVGGVTNAAGNVIGEIAKVPGKAAEGLDFAKSVMTNATGVITNGAAGGFHYAKGVITNASGMITNLAGKAVVKGPHIVASVISNVVELMKVKGVGKAVETFKAGELYETSIELSNGTRIEMIAEVSVDGKAVTLKDITIYSNVGDMPNEVGPVVFQKILKEVKAQATTQGFEKLIINGMRVLNSSSANPGHVINRIFNLIK